VPVGWVNAAGVAVDAQDHVWVIQRPLTLTDDEKALTLTPPRSKCCRPAPPVIEFDGDGNLIRAWGGPSQTYEWPRMSTVSVLMREALSGLEVMEKKMGSI
jgi:hypothetical protein